METGGYVYILTTLLAALLMAGCASPDTPIPDDDPPACNDLHISKAEGLDPKSRTVGTVAIGFVKKNGKVETLINGVPADTKDWPASVYASAGNSRCSATVVGERAVLIAGHCVSDKGRITFSAGSNQYAATCTHHPAYDGGNSTADWTMCLIDRPVTGIAFENIGVTAKLAVGQTVRLTGYGCIRPGGGGGNDGIFRTANSTVRSIPSGSSYDTVTRGGGALCFGDSGGSAYLEGEDGSRVIFGVNSRGDIQTESYLSSTYVPTFVDWLNDWAAKNGNVRVCGMHKDAVGCRGGGSPPVDRKFVVGSKAACVEGVVAPGFEAKKPEIKESVRRALNEFKVKGN